MSGKFLTGFGNHFSTEAVAGALPIGRNSPQKVPFGLYAEQLSGSAFTAPRHENRRSWLYRLRPAASHPAFAPYGGAVLWKSAPFDEIPASPNRLRWDPLAFPDESADFVDGLISYCGTEGVGVHLYAIDRPMGARVLMNADGEMLIVPQRGRLLITTELGRFEVSPVQIALIPRGLRFKVDPLDGPSRGYVCENYGLPFRLPDLGPIGSNGLANPRDFETPAAFYEDVEAPHEIIQKFNGSFWRTTLDHSPFDVVAWHGNLAPCRYDLTRFNTINTVSFDHPDPSIFTVLTSPSDTPGTANCDFVIFPPRWMVAEGTFRPPWFHRNVMSEFMGLIEGAYDAKEGGFAPGGASLHNRMNGHGPDHASYTRAIAADLKPHKIENTMAFMFETRSVYAQTRWAIETPLCQPDYDDCWRDFPKAEVAAMSWPAIDETHDPALACWVEGADVHPDFPVQNLPLGIFSTDKGPARPGVAIGDQILDLQTIAALLPEASARTLAAPTLNALFALPASDRRALRRALSKLLSDERHRPAVSPALIAAEECTLHLPAAIGDYTDFYVGIHHAMNVGKQFRPDNPLLPNYKYVPIGYHGRASSVRPSGLPLVRPNGQRKAPNEDAPSFGPSRRLDYELELGLWIGEGNALGHPIPIAQAPEHIAGLCLLNDWSARDLQAWEYQPLGPFLAKNFHTTVSPWVVTADALAPFRAAQPERPEGDPAPLPYLLDAQDQAAGGLALTLEVELSTERMRAAGLAPVRLSEGSSSAMYWTAAQIVAHHASNGCNLQPGDLLGTGTLSTAEASGRGSLMEISRGGAEPLQLPNGETRSFLEDGDELSLIARGHRDGFASIGFGPCRATVLPAIAV